MKFYTMVFHRDVYLGIYCFYYILMNFINALITVLHFTGLKSLHQWLLTNKISLNKDKTELIYFHKAGSKIPTIKLNGKKLLYSEKIKYLGLCLDETLKGSKQCEEVTQKFSRANGILAFSLSFSMHFFVQGR